MALRDRLRPWALPAAWCGLILVATSVPLPTEDLPTSDLPLDLVGHLVMYLGLGWTVGRAVLRSGWTGAGGAGAAWMGGLGFAALDEWHQAWVPTRVPSLGDWVADAVGLTAGLALVLAAARLRGGTGGGAGRTRTAAQSEPAGRAPGRGAGERGERSGDGEIEGERDGDRNRRGEEGPRDR